MKRFFLLTLAATVLCFGMALAQPGAPPMPAPDFEEFGEPDMRQIFGEKLGLSAEQKEQIHKIMLDTRKKNIEAEAKGKIARIELHELLGADTPDQKKIDAKIAELSQLHEATLRNRVETMLAVKKVLTPEQRLKMKELRPLEHRRARMDKFGHGPGSPRGPRHHMPPRDDEEEEEKE